jgi:hypothetical protein
MKILATAEQHRRKKNSARNSRQKKYGIKTQTNQLQPEQG